MKPSGPKVNNPSQITNKNPSSSSSKQKSQKRNKNIFNLVLNIYY